MTEIYEYAKSLKGDKLSIPHLQMCKVSTSSMYSLYTFRFSMQMLVQYAYVDLNVCYVYVTTEHVISLYLTLNTIGYNIIYI